VISAGFILGMFPWGNSLGTESPPRKFGKHWMRKYQESCLLYTLLFENNENKLCVDNTKP